MVKNAGKTLLLLGALLFLAACSAQAPAALPTPDLNAVRTEAAATVLAQVPQICALTPSATTLPTDTPVPTATNTAAPTLTAAATNLTGTPTATNGTPAVDTGDQAKYVSQSIPDGTRFKPGETFTMTWKVENVGKTTWTPDYRLRFFAGNSFGAPNEIPLGSTVAPGETVDLTVEMKAPASNGTYRSDWVLANANRGNFKEPVYLQIVVGTPTATPTSAATLTLTVTATQPPPATETPTLTPAP